MAYLRSPACAALLGICVAGGVAAQTDYRNLDADRPVSTEDAHPVERHAFEFVLPYQLDREPGGGTRHLVVPELTYGVLLNGHVGVKVPVAAVHSPGSREWGVAGVRVFGLYNFNVESAALPALAVRADVQLPVGNLGTDAFRASFKAIATRAWGRSRIHLNGAYAVGRAGVPAAAEHLPGWSVSGALDRTFYRRSLLTIGEVRVHRLVEGAPIEATAAAGVRYQWGPSTVLDAGVARRLRGDVGPDFAVTIGVTSAFALRAFMGGAP